MIQQFKSSAVRRAGVSPAPQLVTLMKQITTVRYSLRQCCYLSMTPHSLSNVLLGKDRSTLSPPALILEYQR